MDNQLLKTEFYHQLKLGRIALKKNSFKVAFYHFENAHILCALSFNQDLSEWDVRYVSKCSSFSDETHDWSLPKPNLTCN
jgi:hypothetical protein